MSAFFTWFGQTVGQWWIFLYSNDVPGTNFSWATLYIFILCSGFFMKIIRYMINKRLGIDDRGNDS